MKLNELKKPKGHTFNSKRIGRGIGSGKGKTSDPGYAVPQRNGVLRSQVPIWLKEPRLSNLVLQVEPAHHRHGGLGAFYIYLRRNRSN